MIDSILLKSMVKSLDTSSWNENDVRVQEQTMYPLEMNTTREVTKRDNVLFDLNGNPIQAEVEHYFHLNLDGKRVNIMRSEEHTSELQSRGHLVCRLLLEKKKQ